MARSEKDRDAFAKEMLKIYDKTRGRFAAELNDDKFTRISREELDSLRQTSANVEKLVEGHSRLSDELEKARAAAARVEGLEKENKRLARQLQNRLQQQPTPIQTPLQIPHSRIQHGNDLGSTPGTGTPSLSFNKLEANDMPVTKEQYAGIVKKYNSMCEEYLSLKGQYNKVKRSHHNLLQSEKNWGTWMQSTQKTLEKKKDKNRKYEEEIKKLKAILREHGIEPIETSLFDRTPRRDESTPCRPPTRQRGSEVQVPASSPPRSNQHIAQAQTVEPAQDPLAHAADNEDIQLPPNREEIHVAETEFDPLEGHDTSSTQGGSDPVEPELPAREVVAAVAEQIADTSFPVVVTSRTVNKRKQLHDTVEQTPRERVKVEISSSSPIRLPAIDSDGSMDLDDIGDKVDTPRKARHDIPLNRQVSRISASTQDSTQSSNQSRQPRNLSCATTLQSTPPATSVPRETRSILQPRSTNRSVLPRTSDGIDRAPKRRRVATDIGSVAEDGESSPGTTTRHPLHNSECLENLLLNPSPVKAILSPLVANGALQSARPRAGLEQQRAATATSSLAREVAVNIPADIAYSNHSRVPPNLSRRNSMTARSPVPASQGSTATSRPTPQGSLPVAVPSKPSTNASTKTSVEPVRPILKVLSRKSKEPSPDEEMLMRSPTPDPTQLPPRRNVQAFLKESKSKSRPSIEAAKPSPRVSAITGRPESTKKKQGQTEKEYLMDPDQEPLRSRPLHKLNLQDFKINPNYNHGVGYAYSEVVRGDARKCLQGCVKPNCCGPKFRALAEIEIERREAFMAPSQKERDDLQLEDYLGDNAYKIPRLSEDERRELLIKSETRIQANKHGKHRHAYERQPTPPGFWDVDFPSTQKEAEDRRLAKERERGLVEQRYREAMRPGGSYMFRDENP
ncbi:hypothetical protein LZ554_007216 [Drepanopeziza brunnea f. sp. 'monogermtubi']|nr:hypothetical protein LZ554_007216 [Drepanopeziza brunnea f. sp. 'monogermtubi']